MMVPKEPDKKPTVEEMLSGIIAAIETEKKPSEKPSEVQERDRVVLTIESNVRGYVKVTERVTHVEGDEKRTLRDAVESLYTKLASKALDEERNAAQRLLRLGVRT